MPFSSFDYLNICIRTIPERVPLGYKYFNRYNWQPVVVVVVVVIVVAVGTSVPKVYPRVTLASASTLSGSVVRTLRGGEGFPNVFCVVASSLGHLRSQYSIVCGSSLQREHRGSAEGPRRLA